MSASYSPSHVWCDTLTQSLPGAVFTSSIPKYDELINARWSSTSVLYAGFVDTPEDVSTAIKILVKNQCRFAVKAGGHNANPGADLAEDRSYVRIGAGMAWGKSYDAFNNSGICFTGGISEDVGAAGVSLSGGQSLFQLKRGWAVDNILNYEIVLASGEIVDANQPSKSDLFKALKSSNTNFGVATSVKIAAFEFDGIWGGEVFVNLTIAETEGTRPDFLDKISRAITNFIAQSYLDTSTSVQLMTAYLSEGRGQLVNAAFGNTDAVEKLKSLDSFLALSSQVKSTGRNVKLAHFVHEVSQFQAKGYRQAQDPDLIFIWDATDAVYNTLPHKDMVDLMVSFIPQPKIQQTYAAARSRNSLSLANVENYQIVVDKVEAIAKKHNTYHPFLYINYAAPFQNPLCSYDADSANFLKATANKYDPRLQDPLS
ncbi:Fc.00g072550.m01.CDS01 [Cosmosporella sp. VM-42]